MLTISFTPAGFLAYSSAKVPRLEFKIQWGGFNVPNIELTAVFYLTIPDEVDADDVTIEVSEDGVISFAANDEEIATGKDVEGYETLEVEAEGDDDYADEDDDEE
jgi:hypothetical protein